MDEMNLKEPYRKVLAALGNGEHKNLDEICRDCGFQSPIDCAGALSLLRRMRAIERDGRGKFLINDKGMLILQGAAPTQSASRMELNRRPS